MTEQPDATPTETPANPRKTLADHLKALLGAALIVGLTLLMMEVALRVLDPWGMSYFDDLEVLATQLFQSDDERGYIIADGTHQMSHWQFTIEEGTRPVNTNPEAACTVVILGDSVAFGYGVDDGDVWLNDIAQAFPNVQFINTGLPRYNSTNVLWNYQTYPDADAYLYLIINNDLDYVHNPDIAVFAGSTQNMPHLLRYTNFAFYRGEADRRIVLIEGERERDPNAAVLPSDPRLERFFNEIAPMVADERVYLAAFEGEPLTNSLLANDYDVLVMPYPEHRISFADYHLNPTGNDVLAQQLMPLFQQMVDTACSDTTVVSDEN